MVGTKVPFSAFYAITVNLKMPIVAFVIKLTKRFFSKEDLASRKERSGFTALNCR